MSTWRTAVAATEIHPLRALVASGDDGDRRQWRDGIAAAFEHAVDGDRCARDEIGRGDRPTPGRQGARSPPRGQSPTRKASLTDFVTRVTTPDGPEFVPPEDRVAVLDIDGTLWPEAPVPLQLQFVLDELKRRAPGDSKLAADPMVQAAVRGDFPALLADERHEGLLHVLAITHTGMTCLSTLFIVCDYSVGDTFTAIPASVDYSVAKRRSSGAASPGCFA